MFNFKFTHNNLNATLFSIDSESYIRESKLLIAGGHMPKALAFPAIHSGQCFKASPTLSIHGYKLTPTVRYQELSENNENVTSLAINLAVSDIVNSKPLRGIFRPCYDSSKILHNDTLTKCEIDECVRLFNESNSPSSTNPSSKHYRPTTFKSLFNSVSTRAIATTALLLSLLSLTFVIAVYNALP
ncbi:hypothetical protein VCHA53O466_50131 [Vibrio chagasii]|nr:hypothetical protein VCHA53O466_50131 [Vibrio chagasii]